MSASSMSGGDDPLLKISMQEKALIINHHTTVSTILSIYGTEILAAYLVKYPEYQSLFKLSGKLTYQELVEAKHVRNHANVLMRAVTNFMESINTPDVLNKAFEKNAQKHVKLKVPIIAFDQMRKVLLEKISKVPETSKACNRAIERATYFLFAATVWRMQRTPTKSK